jgi:predicted phage tail protein
MSRLKSSQIKKLKTIAGELDETLRKALTDLQERLQAIKDDHEERLGKKSDEWREESDEATEWQTDVDSLGAAIDLLLNAENKIDEAYAIIAGEDVS